MKYAYSATLGFLVPRRHPLFLRFLACQAVEYSPRARKFREALFFLAKFAGVRHQTATGTPGWVLHMQHLVKQHIFHRELRHTRAIHSPVQQDMIWPGIVAAELPSPASIAPANVWTLQLAVKISSVQFLE